MYQENIILALERCREVKHNSQIVSSQLLCSVLYIISFYLRKYTTHILLLCITYILVTGVVLRSLRNLFLTEM